MARYSMDKKWIILIHILFWVIFLGLMMFVYGVVASSVEVMMILVLGNIFGQIILVYVNLLYLIPKLFVPRKYLLYSVALIGAILMTTSLRFFVNKHVLILLKLGDGQIFSPNLFGGLILSALFLLILSIPLILLENYFKKGELEEALKSQQLEAELRFLKAQVNPHFLFNALNNIYALSFTKSDQAPEMILKLSEMMSYMLYDCKAPKVKLDSEIAYLENYIALHQLKKDGEQNITFATSVVDNVMITPMLFIPFFENAFKHGNVEDIDKGWLKSHISVINEELHFNIENTLSSNNVENEKGGIGLTNVRERLDLLYPKKYELKTEEQQGYFRVDLRIDLS